MATSFSKIEKKNLPNEDDLQLEINDIVEESLTRGGVLTNAPHDN